MGEAVSTSHALLLILIAHHREQAEGQETQDWQGKRCGDGLRCHNYRSEVILQELLAIGGHFWLDLSPSSQRLAIQKSIVVVLTVLEQQYGNQVAGVIDKA